MSKEYNDRWCKPLREPYCSEIALNEALKDADLTIEFTRWDAAGESV